MKLALLGIELPKMKRPTTKEEMMKWRGLEKSIAKILIIILLAILAYPLIFWSGNKRWIGILIDVGIAFAIYKLVFRDVPIVNIGMLVSPFWGRIPEYLSEGKHFVLPWDKIDLEELKVKTHSVKEEKGYLTLDGAPINMTVDIFYRIDRNNIYLYKEVEGAETQAIDGKVKEYIYGKIGALETDEVVAHQGDIATGILEEIRLHPISSKKKMLAFQMKKKKLLESELKILEKDEAKTVDKEKVGSLELKLSKIEVDINSTRLEIEILYEKEENKLREEKADSIAGEIQDLEKNELRKMIDQIIEKAQEETLSELERNFAVKILGSRIYGLDIADQDAKAGRSKRTTTMFERTAILTEWGTTNMVMSMLKEKYPDLTDSELLEAVLVNRGRIKKEKKVFEVEGLTKILPELAKVIFKKN